VRHLPDVAAFAGVRYALPLTILAAMLTTAASASSVAAQALSLPDLVERVKPSVVLVKSLDENGKVNALGTGFFVSTGKVVTNLHVVVNAEDVALTLASGRSVKVTDIVAVDSEFDLVILEVPVDRIAGPPLALAPELPREGERVVVVGNPMGLAGTVSEGIISAVRTVPGIGVFIQTTAAISEGSSGSPILNSRGEVTGVATFLIEGGQALNFGITSKDVRRVVASASAGGGTRSARAPAARDSDDGAANRPGILEGVVTRLEGSYLTIDLGARHGVQPGMKVDVMGRSGVALATATVISVMPLACTAELSAVGGAGSPDEGTVVEIHIGSSGRH